MKLTEFLREELDREVERSRKALKEVPEGKYDWKPHERSMIFGYLADMVATIPMWIQMEIERDELDVARAADGDEHAGLYGEVAEGRQLHGRRRLLLGEGGCGREENDRRK